MLSLSSLNIRYIFILTTQIQQRSLHFWCYLVSWTCFSQWDTSCFETFASLFNRISELFTHRSHQSKSWTCKLRTYRCRVWLWAGTPAQRGESLQTCREGERQGVISATFKCKPRRAGYILDRRMWSQPGEEEEGCCISSTSGRLNIWIRLYELPLMSTDEDKLRG